MESDPKKTTLERLDKIQELDELSSSCHRQFNSALVDLLSFRFSSESANYVNVTFYNSQPAKYITKVKPSQTIELIENTSHKFLLSMSSSKLDEQKEPSLFYGFEPNFANRKQYEELQRKFAQAVEAYISYANFLIKIRTQIDKKNQ